MRAPSCLRMGGPQREGGRLRDFIVRQVSYTNSVFKIFLFFFCCTHKIITKTSKKVFPVSDVDELSRHALATTLLSTPVCFWVNKLIVAPSSAPVCLCVREACHVTVVHSKPPFMHVIANRPVGPLRHPAVLLPPLRLHFHSPHPDAPSFLQTLFSSIAFPLSLFYICPSFARRS